MSKQYQAGRKEVRASVGFMAIFSVLLLGLLGPVFSVWGSSWWSDVIVVVVALVVVVPLVWINWFLMGEWTLKLEVDSEGLRLGNWRGSRAVRWAEVTAWCAVEVEDRERLICLKSASDREPFAIDPNLLHGKQFARIYHDIEEHCGPPCPGAGVLGDNEGEPIKDVKILSASAGRRP